MDTSVAMLLPHSGTPIYEQAKKAAKWPSGSALISVLVDYSLNVTLTRRNERVFLTHAHQRIMDRALRRSVRIIA